MFKTMKKRIKNEKGLTLIELLAVVVILAIIAAIAIPAIGNIISNSRAKAQVADAISVLDAANLYFTDNPTDADNTATQAELTNGGYLENTGKITNVSVKKGTPNTITFTVSSPVTGALGNTFTDATLTQLSGATVSKGVITINGAQTAPAGG
ncbi:prepilin-type N-terminal cleavage/methylation domain-containing protein [Lysinibacillus sp. SGAir0095]|uniref:prepilin-type N-terminal cleavage/methylation domain-containing protein n=1 Tax=Lysinibacillus sp. SGAir0095 TaxID=2070463 RepID=UPI00197CAE59|nr:prepilin-type N-terminal cleavage/methylation domain-containing protein [Lysinibacillus sp. SGAir0095]